MSRKSKERDAEYFRSKYDYVMIAAVDDEQFLEMVDRSIESSASKFNGKLIRAQTKVYDDGLAMRVDAKVRGVRPVSFTIVTGTREDGRLQIDQQLEDGFTYMKGSLGTKPEIGGRGPLEKFIANLKAEVAAVDPKSRTLPHP